MSGDVPVKHRLLYATVSLAFNSLLGSINMSKQGIHKTEAASPFQRKYASQLPDRMTEVVGDLWRRVSEEIGRQTPGSESILQLTEEQAYQIFCEARWHSSYGNPACYRCRCPKTYEVRRRRYRCAAAQCRAEFSATTATEFSGRKLSYKKLVAAVVEEISGGDGFPALRLSQQLGVEYKTAWLLHGKLKQARTPIRSR